MKSNYDQTSLIIIIIAALPSKKSKSRRSALMAPDLRSGIPPTVKITYRICAYLASIHTRTVSTKVALQAQKTIISASMGAFTPSCNFMRQ